MLFLCSYEYAPPDFFVSRPRNAFRPDGVILPSLVSSSTLLMLTVLRRCAASVA